MAGDTTPASGEFQAVGWLVKVDGNGDVLWNKTYASSGSHAFGGYRDSLAALGVLSDGSIVLGGSTTNYNSSSLNDDFLVKADANGNELWHKSVRANYHDWISALTILSDDSILLAGRTSGTGDGNGQGALLLKVDANGAELWSQTSDFLDCYAYATVQVLASGSILLLGTSTNGTTWHTGRLFKMDDSGNSLWSRSFGGASDDDLFGLQIQNDGGIFLFGHSKSFGAGSYDGWLLKVNAEGN